MSRTAGGRPQVAARSGAALAGKQLQRLQRGIEAQARGDLAFAEAQFRKLVAERVTAAEPYCRLATICVASNRAAEAHQLLRQAVAVEPGAPEAAFALAASYERLGRHGKAIEHYRRLSQRWPEHQRTARYQLANLLKAQGEFAEAEALYLDLLAAQPDYTQAHFTYSGIHKYRDPADPQLRTMQSLLQTGRLPPARQCQLRFALGKAFDDLGDYPQAFANYQAGNALRRQSFDYDIESDAELFDNIIRTFNRDDLARLAVPAESSARPIFIIGMVRSGTSLVEKILASHSQVHGAGELDYVYSLGSQMFLDPARHYQFRPLADYPAHLFGDFARTYLQKLQALNPDAGRITDKLPFNMLMLGLIHIALPNARIIHCVRDARDTCLSIYRQNFATDNYRFAYDLDSLGRFHNLYRRLMRHWHAVFPGAIQDVSYAALVRQPEPEIRRLLAGCGLEWEDKCLDFHATPGHVNTASFWQVRQPMYTDSAGAWENYREFLQPLLRVLEPE